jgi:hypothetical protein
MSGSLWVMFGKDDSSEHGFCGRMLSRADVMDAEAMWCRCLSRCCLEAAFPVGAISSHEFSLCLITRLTLQTARLILGSEPHASSFIGGACRSSRAGT